ncbi:hypothetical protein Tco_1552694, partial [Tanacetum coccineum]
EQSHSVSSGHVPDPQDPERNKQLAGGNVQPADKGLPSTVSDEALLLSDEKLMEESEDDVFEAGDEIDEDIHHTDEEETPSPSPNKDQPKSSHVHETESDSDSSCLEALKKYDNVLPLTERQLSEIEGFHNAAYKVHKGIEAAFSTYEKLLVKFQAQYGKDAEKILSSLKVIQDSFKEDLALNKKAAIQSDISSLKQDTSDIKSMMSEILCAFKGHTPPSSNVPTITLAITKDPTTVRGVRNLLTLPINLLLTLRGRKLIWILMKQWRMNKLRKRLQKYPE